MAVKKVAKPEPVVEKPVEKPVVNDGIIRCECGEPVAPGQTYVCKGHIRST